MNRKTESLQRLLLGAAAIAAFAALQPGSLFAAATCNVRAYGAKGDGATKDTAAIQKAIDACSEKGGGMVVLPAGTYLSAPIVLKSNVNFHLDKGATLLGSPDHADYPPKVEFHVPDVQPLVSAVDAENISITGEGTINGNGESWWEEAHKIHDAGILGNHPRPKLIILDHSKHILIEGVTVENSPMWQIVPYYADDVTIRNVRILAPQHSPNTDAIDPFSSSHVLIDHVYADVGDDNVAIKSGPINSPGPDSPSTYITIRDCTFMHGHGVSVGSELSGGAQHILAERIHFEGTDNGIRVKANRDRGHDVSDLTFRDITMKDVKNELIISEYYPRIMPPAGGVAPAPVGRLTPFFHDITVENLTATGGKMAGAIVGLPESPVKNVVLRNVNLSAETGLVIGYANVTGTNVHVHAEKGEAIMKTVGANVTLH